MSNTCLIHGNGICYIDTGRGYRDGTGCVVSCTCPPAPSAAPPATALAATAPPATAVTAPEDLSNLRFSQLPATRILRHCYRVDKYKRPEDLPPTARCLCGGECTQQPYSDTEGEYTPMMAGGSGSNGRGSNGSGSNGSGSKSSKGSSNSLERTGACTPQCSCELLSEPCGDRQELPEEHDLNPWRRSDSAIGLDINGNIVKAFKTD